MTIGIGRREFISALGGASLAWPLAARAQQGDRMQRIGVLMATQESDPETQSWKKAFVQRLEELGWTDGRNVRIDYRWANGDAALSRTLARELLGMAPDVVLAVGVASLSALQQETRTVPIVFARVSNPVERGFVASLAKPGGNVTGFSNFEPAMAGKWLQTLKDIAPGINRVALIADPEESDLDGYFGSLTTTAGLLAVEPIQEAVHNLDEMARAIAKVADKPGAGLIFIPDGFTIANRAAVIAQVTKYHLPAIYPFSFFASDGGLASYGINGDEQFRQAAGYVDRVLKGEKPADLPVQAPTKFELVINLKTAKMLGLDIPQPMLLLADEVIE
jgi:putative ABC transport system substrate-binding protein